MRIEVKVDTTSVERMLKIYPRETSAALEEYVERQGRRIQKEAKWAMRLGIAGSNEARSRTGYLANQIRFVKGSQSNGNYTGIVKAFANYSGFVHGPPFDRVRINKNGRPRRINPFFTKAKAVAMQHQQEDAVWMMRNLTRRLIQ